MKSYREILNENFLLDKDSFDRFEKLISKYGFETDNSNHEYDWYLKLDQGVLVLNVDEVYTKGSTLIKNPDMLQWMLRFHPYVKIEKKLFGLIKKRILAKSVDLTNGIFDFGYGIFAKGDTKILADLEKTIKDAIKKVEKLDPEELYSEENIIGRNTNLPIWISGSDSGGFSPNKILYKNNKDRTKKVYEEKVGHVQKKIKFDLDIESTNHSIERLNRKDATGNAAYEPISFKEVNSVISKATEEIIDDLVKDEMDINTDRFVLQRKEDGLTVVGVMQRKGDDLSFVVITLYRGEEFRVGRNQKIIKV